MAYRASVPGGGMNAETLPEHLRSRLIVAPSGCWIWLTRLNGQGYGRAPLGRRGAYALAHRAVYEALVGPIPEGLELDHLCRVRRCVNPRHLQPVTHAENMRRGRGGRHNKDKTSCPAGHPYTLNNIKPSMWRDYGRRQCLPCHNARERARKAVKRAERAA